MTTSSDLAAALEGYIRDEVERQVAAAIAEMKPETDRVAPPRPKAWLSAAKAAARTGRHPHTVADACRTGELFAKQRGKGGSWRICLESLDAWIEGAPDPHREAVERWQRGPKQALQPRKRRPRPAKTDPDGPAAA